MPVPALVVRQYGLPAIEIRKRALEILDLRNVVHRDVGLRRIVDQIILMVALRRIKSFQRIYAGDNRARKRMGAIQLRDVSFGNALLILIGIENGGSILCAGIGSLAIQLRGIVDHGKCDLQYLPVGNGGRVKGYLDRFRMACGQKIGRASCRERVY